MKLLSLVIKLKKEGRSCDAQKLINASQKKCSQKALAAHINETYRQIQCEEASDSNDLLLSTERL